VQQQEKEQRTKRTESSKGAADAAAAQGSHCCAQTLKNFFECPSDFIHSPSQPAHQLTKALQLTLSGFWVSLIYFSAGRET